MVTIFTIPKAFKGKFRIIQRNAVKSWLELPVEVVLFGNEAGVKEITAEFKIKWVKKIKKNAYGTPIISYAFQKIKSVAKFPLFTYINCDIILLTDFIKAINKVTLKRFLMIGQRRPLYLPGVLRSDSPEVNREIVGKKEWQRKINKMLKKQGAKPIVGSSDYFVYPKIVDFPMPPFAVGRLYWDSWLIYHTRKASIPIINATEKITAIHQQHYDEFGKHGYEEISLGKEAKINQKLLGGRQNILKVYDADYLLTEEGLKKPKLTLFRVIRRMEIAIILLSKKYFLLLPVFYFLKFGRNTVTWLRLKLIFIFLLTSLVIIA